MVEGHERGVTFGTDGVRGVANRDLTPEDALRLGYAGARLFGGPVVIGRDTRLSGGMLSSAFAAGAASGGAEVLDLGVLPTPGVAALAPKLGATAAVVVSASHNPFPDNGIKFFSAVGRKLPEEQERELERLSAQSGTGQPTGAGVGVLRRVDDAAERYAAFVLGKLRPRASGLRVLLDCAHGAATDVAPLAFGGLGAELEMVGAEPTGTNINEGCGSTHVGSLGSEGFDVAFAFDGDADRVLAVDEKGAVVDGDKVIAILARDLMERGVLGEEAGVVVTVMSNLGFFKAMDALSIGYEVTPVGDRHVAAAMARGGAYVGGEQSGHVILSEHVTTGDGLVTALALLDVMTRTGRPLSELARVMEVYPQTLVNVPVAEARFAKQVAASEPVAREVSAAERRLGEEGRILLRPSGTEPVVRVMVEHADAETCREVAGTVAETVAAAGAGADAGVEVEA